MGSPAEVTGSGGASQLLFFFSFFLGAGERLLLRRGERLFRRSRSRLRLRRSLSRSRSRSLSLSLSRSLSLSLSLRRDRERDLERRSLSLSRREEEDFSFDSPVEPPCVGEPGLAARNTGSIEFLHARRNSTYLCPIICRSKTMADSLSASEENSTSASPFGLPSAPISTWMSTIRNWGVGLCNSDRKNERISS
jgi:hypothetical protein